MNLSPSVATATNNFLQEIQDIDTVNKALVDELEALVTSAGYDKVDSYFFDIRDNLATHLASDAANEHIASDAQESAISETESWVSNNVSNAGVRINILAAMWYSSPQETSENIRSELNEANPRL